MRNVNCLLVIIILFVFITSCTKDKGSLPAPIVLSDSCTTSITYSQKISKIINNTCAIAGCHVPSGYKDFSTYLTLKSELDAKGITYFLSRIKSGGGMPPSYTSGPTNISTCDYNKIETWLNQSYPNN